MNIISLLFTTILTAELNKSKDTSLIYETIILDNITEFYIEGENKEMFEGATKIYIDYQRDNNFEYNRSFKEDFTKLTLKSLPQGYKIRALSDSYICPPLNSKINTDVVFYFKKTSKTLFTCGENIENENEKMLTQE